LALDLRESEGGDEVMAREEFYEECENFGTVVVVQADVEAESVERISRKRSFSVQPSLPVPLYICYTRVPLCASLLEQVPLSVDRIARQRKGDYCSPQQNEAKYFEH